MYSWKYMCSAVMDGNFSAQHHPMKNPEDDVALADGHLFTVEDAPYKAHLLTAKEYAEVCTMFPLLNSFNSQR